MKNCFHEKLDLMKLGKTLFWIVKCLEVSNSKLLKCLNKESIVRKTPQFPYLYIFAIYMYLKNHEMKKNAILCLRTFESNLYWINDVDWSKVIDCFGQSQIHWIINSNRIFCRKSFAKSYLVVRRLNDWFFRLCDSKWCDY